MLRNGCPCVTRRIPGAMTPVGPRHPPQWLSVLILVAVLDTHVDQPFKCPSIDYQCSFQQFSTLPSSFSPEVLSFSCLLLQYNKLLRDEPFRHVPDCPCGGVGPREFVTYCICHSPSKAQLQAWLWQDLFRNIDELKAHLELDLTSWFNTYSAFIQANHKTDLSFHPKLF